MTNAIKNLALTERMRSAATKQVVKHVDATLWRKYTDLYTVAAVLDHPGCWLFTLPHPVNQIPTTILQQCRVW